jgi:hypothetical protein
MAIRHVANDEQAPGERSINAPVIGARLKCGAKPWPAGAERRRLVQEAGSSIA